MSRDVSTNNFPDASTISATPMAPRVMTGRFNSASGLSDDADERLKAAVAKDRWFAVNTQPHAEARSRINLERQGFPCFFPVYRTSHRMRGRQVIRLKPLFTNYIFLRMDVTQTRWRAIDSTYGVRSIVKQGDMPLALPVGCVEALMSRSDEDGVFSFAAQLSEGSRVTFLNGPFAGFVGVLESLDSRGRIRVLLDLMGRSSTIQSTVSDVAPAPDSSAQETGKDRRIVRPRNTSTASLMRNS